MALPVTISGAGMPGLNYFCGPFKSSGNNFYCVLAEAGTTPEVYKATDPTVSFAAQDAANNPTTQFQSMWAYQVADILHIVTQEATAGGADVRYHTFSMATDTWGTKDEEIEIPAQAPNSLTEGVSIALRSNGNVIVLYSGDTDSIMGTAWGRCDYARKVGSTWTVGVNVGGQALEQYHVAGSVVIGASDRMHFFWRNGAPADLMHRSLSSADALDTAVAADLTTGGDPCRGISYVSGSNTVVKVPYLDGDLSVSSVRINVSAADPTIAVDTAVSAVAVSVLNGVPVACFALDGTIVRLLYSDETTDDLWSDAQTDGGAWGTDVEELDAVNITRISCNVYDRSGSKLAYVYNDDGTVKYNEKSLAAAAEIPFLVMAPPQPAMWADA